MNKAQQRITDLHRFKWLLTHHGIVAIVFAGLFAPIAHAADKGRIQADTSRTAHALQVTDAWARATVPGQPVGAAYMKIASSVHVVLLHAETDVAKEVQVHDMHVHDGVMQMRDHGRLQIPAGQTIELAPGGKHFMLIGLKKSLKAGDKISLKLTFADRNNQKTTSVIQAPIRPIGR